MISSPVEWKGGAKTYYNFGNEDKVIAECEAIVRQYVEADQAGFTEFELVGHEKIDPGVISQTLYRHHIIGQPINAIIPEEP